MQDVVIRRRNKIEAERAIKDLEDRGFEVVFPLTPQYSSGKLFKADNYKRRIFVANIDNCYWVAKLRRMER